MYILHLSDLHFGNFKNAETWHALLATDLVELRKELQFDNPDVLIISGDIANQSTEEEYNAAKKFIYELKDTCLIFDSKKIIIVPGNHDLNWKLCDECYTQTFSDDRFSITVDQDKYKHRFDHFSSFYKEFKKKAYPLNYDEQTSLDILDEEKLLVLGLNSAWKLSRHETKDANINTNALDKALNEIRDVKYQDYVKIAVWHHPINANEDDRIKDDSFLKRLAAQGFHLGLHGHIHEDHQGKSFFRYQGQSINILAAGTFGASTKSLPIARPWQYQLLKIQDNQVNIYIRKKMGIEDPWVADNLSPVTITLSTLSNRNP